MKINRLVRFFSLFWKFVYILVKNREILSSMSGIYELINMPTPTRAQESEKKFTQWLRINTIKIPNVRKNR